MKWHVNCLDSVKVNWSVSTWVTFWPWNPSSLKRSWRAIWRTREKSWRSTDKWLVEKHPWFLRSKNIWTVEPHLRGQMDERPLPLERPLGIVNLNINVLISTPDERPLLLKGHFSATKGVASQEGFHCKLFLMGRVCCLCCKQFLNKK